jgi:hypothetical protein
MDEEEDENRGMGEEEKGGKEDGETDEEKVISEQ